MKQFKCILTVVLIFFGTPSFCQVNAKQFLGTWTTRRTDEKSFSVTEEIWVFENTTSGSWTRKLILSNGVVVCDISNPFTWKLLATNKLDITLGKTSCKCSATKKQFEEGLETFIKNYKESYNNEYFSYKIKYVDTKTISLDNFILKKQ